MNFLVPLLKDFLPRSLVIELLAKLLLESKKKGRIFSSKKDEKKDEIGFENILRTINVSKNFGCL